MRVSRFSRLSSSTTQATIQSISGLELDQPSGMRNFTACLYALLGLPSRLI